MKYKYYLLEISVFVSGAVVMIFELAGSRILGPYLGTSIYVWTSLIGVILGSLSLGYYWGGKLADKKTSLYVFASLFFFASLAILAMVLAKDLLMAIFRQIRLGMEIKSFLVSVLLFGPASFILGMISPYAAKIKLNNLSNSGSTVGNLYAISTLGSISGTFLAGYFLIPLIGTTKIIISLGITLIVISIILYPRKKIKTKAAVLILFGALSVFSAILNKENSLSRGFIDVDTKYNRVWISSGRDYYTKRAVLNLATDPFGTQSSMYLDEKQEGELVFTYLKFFDLADYFFKNPQNVLMIGGSAYSFPRYFLVTHPNSKVDVLEIDPGVTEIARKYFRLKEDNRLNIFHTDARVFLNENSQKPNKYDVIYGDAFTSFSCVPYQLSTIEAVKREFEILNPNGLVILNIMSSVTGRRGEFVQAELATYKQIFPQVYIFPVNYPDAPEKLQNVILVALKSKEKPSFKGDDPGINKYLKNLWQGEADSSAPILTDDYAPVDYFRKRTL